MANLTQTAPLTEAQRTAIDTSLATIGNELSFLVSLEARERQALSKMGQKTRAFVEDAIELGIRNPGMLPRSLDPDVMRGRLDLVDQLREIQGAIQQLEDRISDTLTLAGSELYDEARLIYQLTKTLAKAPGVDSAVQSLSQRFAGQGRRTNGDSSSTAAAA
jgi:hypothetical protein